MSAWLLPALFEGGKAVGGWLVNKFNQPPSFDKTPYGQRLKQLQSQGIYSPSMRTSMIGDVGRTTGNIAQGARASYSGRLESMGMGDSIAGQRGINEIESSQMQQVADYTGKLNRENAMSKVQAANEYAQSKTAYKQGVDQTNRQSNMDLVTGLAGAGMTAVQGKLAQDQLAATNEYRQGMVDKQKSYYDMLTSRELSKDQGFTPIEFKNYSETDVMNWINQASNDFEYEQRNRAYAMWRVQQDNEDNQSPVTWTRKKYIQ